MGLVDSIIDTIYQGISWCTVIFRHFEVKGHALVILITWILLVRTNHKSVLMMFLAKHAHDRLHLTICMRVSYYQLYRWEPEFKVKTIDLRFAW